MPALIATDVCRHLRNGEECITTFCFFLGGPCPLAQLCLALLCVARVLSMFAIRDPNALAWFQPPYVRGGSYGAGDVRCHSASAASSRAPCLPIYQSMYPNSMLCIPTHRTTRIAEGARVIFVLCLLPRPYRSLLCGATESPSYVASISLSKVHEDLMTRQMRGHA